MKNKEIPSSYEELREKINFGVLFSQEWLGQIMSSVSPFEADRLDTEGKDVSIYKIDDFLSSEDCEFFISKFRDKLKPSEVTGNELDFRTSRVANMFEIEEGDEDIWRILNLDVNISNRLNLHPSLGENLQFEYFQAGEYFKPHTDYFEPDSEDYLENISKHGQRTWTFQIFLNDVENGGETAFPHLSAEIKPKRGTALIWNNLDSSGTPNYLTLHEEKLVTKESKAIITKWFRDKRIH